MLLFTGNINPLESDEVRDDLSLDESEHEEDGKFSTLVHRSDWYSWNPLTALVN